MVGDSCQSTAASWRAGGWRTDHAVCQHHSFDGRDFVRCSCPRASHTPFAACAPLRRSVQGGWRAKVVDGRLYIKLLHARKEWAERASVLRMLLSLAPALPNLDVVYVHSDHDPAPELGWRPDKRCRWRQPCPEGAIPLLTNAFAGPFRGYSPRRPRWFKSSLPVPDFTWVGWGSHQSPWCLLGPSLGQAAEAQPWQRRVNAAFFAGSLENGKHRVRLARLVADVASASAATNTTVGGGGDKAPPARAILHVHATESAFLHYAKSNGSRRVSVGGKGTNFLPIDEACRYRYALSVPGYGYSSRLRALLACGCTVIHIQSLYREFYHPVI